MYAALADYKEGSDHLEKLVKKVEMVTEGFFKYVRISQRKKQRNQWITNLHQPFTFRTLDKL
jgi:hypothetical protein